MMLTIDTARPEDAKALGRILSDWIDETPWMPRLRSRAEDRSFVADLIHSKGVLVARDDAEPVGFLFERDCHIGALYIARRARGHHLGKHLVDRIKEACNAIDLWTFEANEDARRFYEREGFRVVERTRGDNDEGLPDLRMAWTREAAHG
jgi:GNAT superfamily N-acetyltransferase